MVSTDPHGDKTKLNDPHKNPEYDPDTDGDIENVDAETVEDIVAALVKAGDNVTVSYDDAADSLEIASSGGGGFEDTDADGDAELQTSHADFQGGDAKNVGTLSADDLYTPSAAWDYLLFEDSGTYKAVDAAGLIDSGSDFSTVAQSLADNIPSRSTDQVVDVQIRGGDSDVTLTSTVTFPSAVRIDVTGRFDVQDGSTAGFLSFESSSERVWISGYGCEVHGGNATSPGTAFDLSTVGEGGIKGGKIDGMGTGILPGSQVRVHDVDIGACSGNGILTKGSDGWVSDCDIGTCNNGIVLDHGGWRVTQTNLFLHDGDGLDHSNNTGETHLIGVHSDSNNRAGFNTAIDRTIFIGCTARNNGQDANNTDNERAGFRIFGNRCAFIGCSSFDDQGTATQRYGFSNNGDYNRYVGNGADGNGAGAYLNALSSNSVSAANIPTLS